MTSPEEAIEQARERAAGQRSQDPAAAADPAGLGASITSDRPGLELLSEWSVIEVDRSTVYSTRRAGAPITALKRLLLRLLRQYHGELEARQTRFNIALLSQFRDLEARVSRLESERGAGVGDLAPGASPRGPGERGSPGGGPGAEPPIL
jgi:hypothetical protein